ncbi:HFL037Wp [Eremothecium sinecaudum]|uniref:HFL037Wp n=1 Tax=Eremothecium sinecaudum TaxID=45286 RepID=A0A0X8HUT5_9SACH|nr:HFL037Wp [Eremothecium sinecaudum]AMD21819.1 HFL037Wp [Eremothecium sinecaudum]
MEQEPHVIFMNPQTENLQKLYELSQKLSGVLQARKQETRNLIRQIDTLARKSNEEEETKAFKKDLRVSELFLKQRGIECGKNGPVDNIDALKEHNKKLTDLLTQKTKSNEETVHLLRFHEDSLSMVVKMLRDDVFNYHIQLVEKCRKIFNQRVCEVEDQEFSAYLDNITSLQELIDISRAYQSILRLE